MTTLWLTQELTGSILDVGGGGEGVIGRLYGPSVTIIDHCQEELDEAPCSCRKLRMDASSLSFAGASFENVTFFYSLMYMNRPVQSAAIAEAVRVLKPGGRLLLWGLARSPAPIQSPFWPSWTFAGRGNESAPPTAL